MKQLNDAIIPTATAATITSPAIPALNLFYCSVQVTTTGAGAGTAQLQASNDDPHAANAVPVNWSNISGATVTTTGAGAFLIPTTQLCYQWIRLVYTNTGTGTVTAVLKALGD